MPSRCRAGLAVVLAAAGATIVILLANHPINDRTARAEDAQAEEGELLTAQGPRERIRDINDPPSVLVRGIDLHGNDLPGLSGLPASTASECNRLCGEEPACNAWGWNDGTNPDWAQLKHQCFLKGLVNGTDWWLIGSANPAVTSGVMCHRMLHDNPPPDIRKAYLRHCDGGR